MKILCAARLSLATGLLGVFLFSAAAQAQSGTGTVTGAATTGVGPMLVYKLTFESAGESINYRPFDGGYYIAPITGGSGSLVLTRVSGNVRSYYDYTNFGELFLALKGTNRKAVISATATNSVSATTFFAVGDATDKITISTASLEGTTFVASTLKGYAVSADSERDLPFASATASDIGVAGASYLTARLDEAFSERAKDQNATLAATLQEVLTLLTDQGFTDGTPVGTGSSTSGSTTSGSATGGTSTGGTSTGGFTDPTGSGDGSGTGR